MKKKRHFWLVNKANRKYFELWEGRQPPTLTYSENYKLWVWPNDIELDNAVWVMDLCSTELLLFFPNLALPELGEAVHVLIDIQNVGPNGKDASVSLEDAGYEVVIYERENETIEY